MVLNQPVCFNIRVQNWTWTNLQRLNQMLDRYHMLPGARVSSTHGVNFWANQSKIRVSLSLTFKVDRNIERIGISEIKNESLNVSWIIIKKPIEQ